MVLQCRDRERVFCTSMTLSTSIAGEKRRQGMLWGFTATVTNGCSPKKREKRRVFPNNECGGGQMLHQAVSKVSSTFQCKENCICTFHPIQTEQLILKQMKGKVGGATIPL